MSNIDFNNIEYFAPYEFVDNLNHVEPQVIYNLDKWRDMSDDYYYPSPVFGSMVRYNDKSSMHYSNKKDILSKAIDGFSEGDLVNKFFLAMTSKLWNGIGVYLDTEYDNKFWPMFHFDIRELGYGFNKETILIWIRKKGKYYYPQAMNNGRKFLMDTLEKLTKISKGKF